MKVRVSFLVDASDPDHDMGISEEDHERITEVIMFNIGTEDEIEFEKVEE